MFVMHVWDPEPETMYASLFEERIVFFLVAVGVLTLTFGFFFVIDFLPEKPEIDTSVSLHDTLSTLADTAPVVASVTPPSVNDADTVQVDPYPLRIVIDTLDREVAVLNPESSSIAALDTALLSGAVRHPDSADFERKGTIVLFGHSSYLPNVINKNFQAFNGIQKLVWGDTIRVFSADTEYV